MNNLLRLSDLDMDDVLKIFKIADQIENGNYRKVLQGKTIVMFFPSSSIRTRVTFEKGIYLLGGQSILFEPSTLDKKESIKDVIGYLNNYADGLIVRYSDIHKLEEICKYAKMPVINAMTDINHPCEMLSDMYAISKRRSNYGECNYLFVGPAGNIGYAWKECSELFGFELMQCCPIQYKMKGVNYCDHLKKAIENKDIVCTDSLKESMINDFEKVQITTKIMDYANDGAILNPCPPFYRGEEVSEDVIDSKYFVGYDFKKSLLTIQMAIMIYMLSDS